MLFSRLSDFAVSRILIFADPYPLYTVNYKKKQGFSNFAEFYFRGLDVKREKRENNMSVEKNSSTVGGEASFWTLFVVCFYTEISTVSHELLEN